MLVEEIPIDILRTLLTSASHCKSPLKTTAEVAAMTELQIKDESLHILKDNKGSISMHEWFLSKLDVNSVPATLGNIIDTVTRHMAGSFDFGCSLMI